MPICHIALGGNLGSVFETFDQAIGLLDSLVDIQVLKSSHMYWTAAVGNNVGGEFLNAVSAIETNLEPLQLLQTLQSIEVTLDRKRDFRWGPRTIDLDLIFYSDQIIDRPGLHVPHPACWYRRFVLDPLVEIAADFMHPEKRCSVQKLRERLLVRPFRLALVGADEMTRIVLITVLSREFPDVEFSHGPCQIHVSDQEPTILIGLDAPNEHRASSALASDGSHTAWLDASAVEYDRAIFVQDVIRSALCRCQHVLTK